MEMLQQLDSHWIWFGLSMALLFMELFGGRFKFLGASVAALIVGGLAQFFPYVGFTVEALFFVVLAAIFVWMGASFHKEQAEKRAHLERVYRDKVYLGNEFVLETPMSNGQGNILLDGVTWQLRGPSCDKGQAVRVVEMGQGMLRVEIVGA